MCAAALHRMFYYQLGTNVPLAYTFRAHSINYHKIVLKSCQIVDEGIMLLSSLQKQAGDKLFVSTLCNVMYEHAIIHV